MTYKDPLLVEVEREERERKNKRLFWFILAGVALVAAGLAIWSGPRPKKGPPLEENIPVEIIITPAPESS